jgi:hypothetical protein
MYESMIRKMAAGLEHGVMSTAGNGASSFDLTNHSW